METYAVDLNYGYSWFLAFLVGNSHYTLPITQTTIETGDIRQKCFDAHSGKWWEISYRRLIFQGFFGVSGGKWHG